jgi:type I restriction enzyme S subunit
MRGGSGAVSSIRHLQKFPLAPFPEQHRIVAAIEMQFTRLDAGVAALKRVQAGLRRYKASALKAACEGRLVPTEAELARTESRAYEPADALLARILAERRRTWEDSHPGKHYEAPPGPDTRDLPALPEGWVWAMAEQITEQRLGKMLDKVKNKGTPRPYLRNINVRWFGFDFSDIQYMRVTDEELAGVSVRSGDLVVCEGGEPGRAAVWSRQGESMVIQKALHRVRPLGGISSQYLAYALAASASTGFLTKFFSDRPSSISRANHCVHILCLSLLSPNNTVSSPKSSGGCRSWPRWRRRWQPTCAGPSACVRPFCTRPSQAASCRKTRMTSRRVCC